MIYSIRKKQFMFVLTSIYIYFSSHNGCKKLVSNELNICVKFKGFFFGGGGCWSGGSRTNDIQFSNRLYTGCLNITSFV